MKSPLIVGVPVFRAVIEMDAAGNVVCKFNKAIPIPQWISILCAMAKGNADQLMVNVSGLVGQGNHLSGPPPESESKPEQVGEHHATNGNGQA